MTRSGRAGPARAGAVRRLRQENEIPLDESPRRATRSLLLAALWTFGLAAAAAAQKTDVLTLNNGDRVTCEIKSYSNGYLTVSTDHSGTINVKWNRLVGISSAKQFDIETTDGIHHFGSLALSDPAGKLVILFADGSLTVAFLEVFDIAPVYRNFWRRIDGSLDLGFNYTESTSLTQFNLNADATYRERNWSATTELSSFYSRQEEADAAKRGSLKMRYDRFLPGNWVAEGVVGFEQNVQLGLDLRTSLAIGGGRYLVKTNQAQLLVFVGFLGNQERPVEGEVKYNAEALAGGRYSYFMYDFPKLTLAASAAVYPSLTVGGRVRLQADASVKREIISDFYLSLSAFYSLDTRDPSTGESRHDWGPTLSVGWTF